MAVPSRFHRADHFVVTGHDIEELSEVLSGEHPEDHPLLRTKEFPGRRIRAQRPFPQDRFRTVMRY
ncbi:MAG: hypothetical protein Kow00128_20570 [Deltaproteobacteria bacterium]